MKGALRTCWALYYVWSQCSSDRMQCRTADVMGNSVPQTLEKGHLRVCVSWYAKKPHCCTGAVIRVLQCVQLSVNNQSIM